MSHVPNKTNRSQATPPFSPDAKTISPLAPSGQQLPQVPPDPRLTPTHPPFLRDTRVLPRGTSSARPRPPGRHIRQSGAAPHPPAPILSSRLVPTSNSWSTWASMRTKEANFCFETFARRDGYIHPSGPTVANSRIQNITKEAATSTASPSICDPTSTFKLQEKPPRRPSL